MRLDGFGQDLGEFDVGGVTRTCREHVSLDEASRQGQIPDDVQQFVTRGLVREAQVRGVEHAGLVGCAGQGFASQGLRDARDLLVAVGTLGEHDGVVDVSAFDEPLLRQSGDFFQEHERAAWRDVLVEFGQRLHACVLRAEDGAVVVHHDGGLEFIFFQRHHHHLDAVLAFEAEVASHLEELPVGLLGHGACSGDGFHERLGRSVEDGHFRTVNAQAGVVHA